MDPIQRRLALIDRQLAKPPDIYKQFAGTSPLLFCAVGLIVGTLVQNAFDLALSIWLVLLAIAGSATVVIFITRQKGGSYTFVLLSSCALVCFVCLGAIRLISFNQPKANDIRNLVGAERQLATIRGPILTEPYTYTNQQWKFAGFTHTDPTSSFYLKLDEVETINGWAKVTGTIRVRVDEPVLDLQAGDYIQAYCWLDRFKPATNPGQFDTARYLARKNIFVAASVKSRGGICLLESGSAGSMTRIKRKLRQTAARALLGELPPHDQNAGLLEALLLGYRGNIDSGTYQAFRRTGLLHFISLSGMHLGILVGIIWWLCKTAGFMKPARSVVCIIVIAVFLLIVPPRAPTLRAAIICFVFCASFLFRRKSNPLNTLSLAAIILLLIKPTDLFGAGWQLSFASVLGLVLFCERIHFFLYEKITGIPWGKKAPKTRPFFRIISRPGPYLLRLFSTSLTAWLSGAGILLYHFYTITPLTVIWAVIAFPFVALILTLGFLKIILFFLLPSLSALLGVFVTALAQALIWAVKLIAPLGISQILIGRVPPAPVIFYYCIIAFVGFVYLRRPLLKRAILMVSVCVLLAFVGGLKWQRTYRNDLVLTCLDVGHGQAIVVQLPGKANIIFDAGSLHKADVGRRIVAPFLNYNGTGKIDCIIISHNDVDHINAIPEIVEHCRVGVVYANDAFFDKADEWGTAKFLNDCLHERGLEVQPLAANLKPGGAAVIKFLWPNSRITQSKELSDNDSSLVTLIEFAGKKILLCSDIEQFAQRKLLQLYPHLKADIVVAPHHGSAKTADADFLNRLQAAILIHSCGRSQYEKQQHSEPPKAAKFYTYRHGAITIRIDAEGRLTTTTSMR